MSIRSAVSGAGAMFVTVQTVLGHAAIFPLQTEIPRHASSLSPRKAARVTTDRMPNQNARLAIARIGFRTTPNPEGLSICTTYAEDYSLAYL